MRIPKSIYLPLILLAYLGFMSYIGYPGYVAGVNSPLYYFGIIGLTLLCIILLHFFLRRRERLRKEREDDIDHGNS